MKISRQAVLLPEYAGKERIHGSHGCLNVDPGQMLMSVIGYRAWFTGVPGESGEIETLCP